MKNYRLEMDGCYYGHYDLDGAMAEVEKWGWCKKWKITDAFGRVVAKN